MSNYLRKFNPWTKKLQWVMDTNLLKIKGSVETVNDLPLTGNNENDCYIVKDTDRLYTWSIPDSSGTIDKWLDVGSTTEIDWSGIQNKPSSSVENIDGAVDASHTQDTDTKLAEGTVDEVSANELRSAVDASHTQGTDTTLGAMTADIDMNNHSIVNLKDNSITFKGGGEINRADYLDSIEKKHTQDTDKILDKGGADEVSAFELRKTINNIGVLAFYRAVDNSKSKFQLDNYFMDEFFDETGVDLVDSENLEYDSSEECYQPLANEETTALTRGGDILLKTGQKKFGTASSYANSNTALWSTTNTDIMDLCKFGTNDFTVEFFVYMTEQKNDTQTFFHLRHSGAGDSLACSFIFWLGEKYLQLQNSVTGHSTITPYDFPTNSWVHFAMVKKDGTMKVYVEGTEIGSFDWTTVNISNFNTLDIHGITGNGCRGYMDEFRISKIARYSANFTPPSEAFSIDKNTCILCHFDGDDDAIATNALYPKGVFNMKLVSDTGIVLPHLVPVSHFKLNDDEATTVVINDGYIKNNGTSSHDTEVLSDIGKINKCFYFVDDNKEITFSDTKLPKNNSSRCIAFWIKSGTSDASYRTIVSYGTAEEATQFFTVVLWYGKILVSQWGDSIEHTTSIADSNWHWVCVWTENGTTYVSIDNATPQSKTMTINTVLTGTAYIGYHPNQARFRGYLDDIRIYDTVLDEEQRDFIYNEGNGTEDNIQTGKIVEKMRIVIFQEDIDAVAENIDMVVKVSRDGHLTYEQASLINDGYFWGDIRIFSALVDLKDTNIGTFLEYEIQTANEKDLKIHAVGLSWQ